MVSEIDTRPAFGTGTPHGITSKLKWLECPLRAELDKVGASHVQDASPHSRVLMGTVVHHFLELFYRGEISGDIEPLLVEWPEAQLLPRERRSKATKICRYYRASYEPDELGEVVGVEEYFEVLDFYGHHLTGRLDLIVDIDYETCGNIMKSRNLLLAPGRYIVDHKTTGAFMPGWAEKFEYSLQLWTYMMAYQGGTPDVPLAGCLVNAMTTDSVVPDFRTIFVPPPSPSQQETVRYVLDLARKWSEAPFPLPTYSNCFGFNRTCPHLLSGMCQRRV